MRFRRLKVQFNYHYYLRWISFRIETEGSEIIYKVGATIHFVVTNWNHYNIGMFAHITQGMEGDLFWNMEYSCQWLVSDLFWNIKFIILMNQMRICWCCILNYKITNILRELWLVNIHVWIRESKHENFPPLA